MLESWEDYQPKPPEGKVTELDFDTNYIHAKIVSSDYELEFSYKTNMGDVMDYVEFDLNEINKNIIEWARNYLLNKVKE